MHTRDIQLALHEIVRQSCTICLKKENNDYNVQTKAGFLNIKRRINEVKQKLHEFRCFENHSTSFALITYKFLSVTI